jgi:hypothetical protein
MHSSLDEIDASKQIPSFERVYSLAIDPRTTVIIRCSLSHTHTEDMWTVRVRCLLSSCRNDRCRSSVRSNWTVRVSVCWSWPMTRCLVTHWFVCQSRIGEQQIDILLIAYDQQRKYYARHEVCLPFEWKINKRSTLCCTHSLSIQSMMFDNIKAIGEHCAVDEIVAIECHWRWSSQWIIGRLSDVRSLDMIIDQDRVCTLSSIVCIFSWGNFPRVRTSDRSTMLTCLSLVWACAQSTDVFHVDVRIGLICV